MKNCFQRNENVKITFFSTVSRVRAPLANLGTDSVKKCTPFFLGDYFLAVDSPLRRAADGPAGQDVLLELQQVNKGETSLIPKIMRSRISP